MSNVTGTNALLVMAALAALCIIAITTLAAIAADVPPVLEQVLLIVIGLVAGGGVVKGADVANDKRTAEIRAAWRKTP